MHDPVITKHDFVRRYSLGEFGNASPTWDTLEECLQWPKFGDEGYQLFHIRNRTASGKTYYDVPWDRLDRKWHQLSVPSQWYISAMAPTRLTLIQGEVMRSPHHLYFYYSLERKPMRLALLGSGQSAEGITARCLLRRYLCSRSLEWLEYLLEEYHDHVVEFSTYDCLWGTVPGYNTVFWEVRRY